MNNEMAYLLGMICGNGEIKRGLTETIVSIEIPHKKLLTEQNNDVRVYVKASIADIKKQIEPLISTILTFSQSDSVTTISFIKPNADYLIREILAFVGNASSHDNIRISKDVFSFSRDYKIQFLRGFSDVTGYIRKSNYYFDKHMHRVYLEIPNNWELVVDICNLLKDVDIPVQTIDWAHPNMRDGNLVKFKQGKPNFWKKEHQIKIFANEFIPVGFAVLHKMQALNIYANELTKFLEINGKTVKQVTHRYYWDISKEKKEKIRPNHPGENDSFIPSSIRGKHFNSWCDIAKELGYGV